MPANSPLVCMVEEVVQETPKKPRGGLKPWITRCWPAIFGEFLSTALLLLLGCMCSVPINGFPLQPPLYGPLGFGLIVLINIQTFGHISGALMNPSVTLAAVIWGKVSVSLAIAYFMAQCVGAVAGYGVLVALSSSDSSGVCVTQPSSTYTPVQALGYEIVLTASLILITCAAWDPVNEKNQESNSIKFGLTIAGLSIAGGPLTGASMNPARSLAPALWNNVWTHHWVYWLGPLAGAAAAAFVYKIIFLKTERKMVRVVAENCEDKA